MHQVKKKRKFDLQGKIIFRLWANCIIEVTHWITLFDISFFNLILNGAYIQLCSAHPSSSWLVHLVNGYEYWLQMP